MRGAMTPPSARAQRIARGLPVEPWEHTATHPVHGALTFRAQVPLATAIAEHYVAIDNRLGNLNGTPRGGTMLLVAALAGMAPPDPVDAPGKGLLMDLPVIAEERTEGEHSDTVVKVFYDPDLEVDVDFLTDVWLEFSQWRNGLLEEVDAVKGSSGETDGSGSSDESSVPSVSPGTTPA